MIPLALSSSARTAYRVVWLLLAAAVIFTLLRTPDVLNTAAAVLCAWVGGLITWPLVGDLRATRERRTATRSPV